MSSIRFFDQIIFLAGKQVAKCKNLAELLIFVWIKNKYIKQKMQNSNKLGREWGKEIKVKTFKIATIADCELTLNGVVISVMKIKVLIRSNTFLIFINYLSSICVSADCR